ncbi:MAG: hypothetical protein ABGZ17_25030 [Planctomycetaceae bacterium]
MTIDVHRHNPNRRSIANRWLAVCHVVTGLLVVGLITHPSLQISAGEQTGRGGAPQRASQVSAAQDQADDAVESRSLPRANSAIQRMESARRMLASQITDASVQDLQRQIVADLQKLLEQQRSNLRQDQPRPQPMSDPPAQPERQPSPQPAQDKNKPQNAPQTEDQPQESTDRTDPASPTQVQLRNRERLIQGVWGHLKPEFRQEFLKLADERNLPQYDHMIQRYYRSLGEIID